jgi:hypothetical protein
MSAAPASLWQGPVEGSSIKVVLKTWFFMAIDITKYRWFFVQISISSNSSLLSRVSPVSSSESKPWIVALKHRLMIPG